jgi:YD repeat-containing protein
MTKMPQPTNWSARFDLKYDAWNRLVEVKGGTTTVQANEYDALGRRIRGGSYYYYYNEEWQVLEVRYAGDSAPWGQYIWHPYYVDALAVCYSDPETDEDVDVQYFLHDANYNVTALTDDSGAVLGIN